MTTVAPRADGLPSQADVMVQADRENFPVANAVLGRRKRHLMAIYGFARLVDDVGDEVASGRGELLDLLEGELDRIYAGAQPRHPVMLTLADTIRACALPPGPFRRLIEANRRDQVMTRYDTFEQLLGYCHLSAAPVGELVLHVFGAATPKRVALSDRICAALQIIEHIQDIGEDYARGRIYVPCEDLVRFGCGETELSAPLRGPAGRALVAFEAARARSLLADGAPLARTLPAPQRIAVGGFVAGGRTALRELDRGRTRGRSSLSRRIGFVSALPRAVMGR